MIVEITEEEREFLQRICERAQVIGMTYAFRKPKYSKDADVNFIKRLVEKFATQKIS